MVGLANACRNLILGTYLLNYLRIELLVLVLNLRLWSKTTKFTRPGLRYYIHSAPELSNFLII